MNTPEEERPPLDIYHLENATPEEWAEVQLRTPYTRDELTDAILVAEGSAAHRADRGSLLAFHRRLIATIRHERAEDWLKLTALREQLSTQTERATETRDALRAVTTLGVDAVHEVTKLSLRLRAESGRSESIPESPT